MSLIDLARHRLDVPAATVITLVGRAERSALEIVQASQGALSYHVVNRRLVSLRNRGLVEIHHPGGNRKVFRYRLTPEGITLLKSLEPSTDH